MKRNEKKTYNRSRPNYQPNPRQKSLQILVGFIGQTGNEGMGLETRGINCAFDITTYEKENEGLSMSNTEDSYISV